MAAQFSKPVTQFRKLMGVVGALHLGLAVWLAIWPGTLLWIINGVARVVKPDWAAPNLWRIPADEIWNFVLVNVPKPTGEMIDHFPEHALFLGMAVAYLLSIAVVGLLAAIAPRVANPYVPIALAGKTFVGLFGLGYFLWSRAYLANLVLPIIDLPLALVVLIFWLRARDGLDGSAAPLDQ